MRGDAQPILTGSRRSCLFLFSFFCFFFLLSCRPDEQRLTRPMKERGNLFGFDHVVGGESVRKRWTQEGFFPLGRREIFIYISQNFLVLELQKSPSLARKQLCVVNRLALVCFPTFPTLGFQNHDKGGRVPHLNIWVIF